MTTAEEALQNASKERLSQVQCQGLLGGFMATLLLHADYDVVRAAFEMAEDDCVWQDLLKQVKSNG